MTQPSLEESEPTPAAGRLRNTAVATGGIVFGSVPGMLLPFAITAWFGAAQGTDAYFLTFAAALYAGNILGLVMERLVVPYAAEALLTGAAAFASLLRRLVLQAALVASVAYLGASLVLVLGIVPTTGFGEEERRLVVQLALLFAPYPVLATASAVLAGGLFSVQRFAVATWSQALRAIGALLAGLLLHDELGLPAIAAGLSLGEACRVALLLVTLRRARRTVLPGAREGAPAGGFWKVAFPHILSMTVIGLAPLVDRSIATTLAAGSVTVLELADKLYYAPSVLIGSGFATVSGAAWAAMKAEGRQDELRRDFLRSQRASWLVAAAVAVVAAAVLWALSGLLQDVAGIPRELPLALTFAVLVIGLPFGISVDLSVRMLVAFRRTWIFVAVAVLLLALKVVGGLVGAALFGLPGIAAAGALTRITNAVLLGIAALRLVSADVPALSSGAAAGARA